MLAYNNDPTVKTNILIQLQEHHDQDKIVKGQYWKNGKGCAVGCTLHSGNHIEYERRFGIPVMLAHLEDNIFEGLPNDKAQLWPMRFMEAIRVGADLSKVGAQFRAFLLIDETHGVIRYAQHDEHRAIINEVAQALLSSSENFSGWDDLRRRAWAIRDKYWTTATATAAYAAYAAYATAAYAADATYTAATTAATAADAYAAGDALPRAASGGAAPQAAASAVRPRVTWGDARAAHCVVQSDKLIELLAAA